MREKFEREGIEAVKGYLALLYNCDVNIHLDFDKQAEKWVLEQGYKWDKENKRWLERHKQTKLIVGSVLDKFYDTTTDAVVHFSPFEHFENSKHNKAILIENPSEILIDTIRTLYNNGV